ncbi:hypothetical protein D3C83_60030 [compost metagenome]
MKRAIEQRALVGNAVDVRGLHVRMSARAEFVEPQVIDQDDEQIRFSRHTISHIAIAAIRRPAGQSALITN